MDTIVVSTFETVADLIQQRGSRSWRINPFNARRAKYLVCVHSRHSKRPGGELSAKAGAAFFIGKVAEIISSPDAQYSDRFQICVSEGAIVDFDDIWINGHRNPVFYAVLNDLVGPLNVKSLQFFPLQDMVSPLSIPTPAVSQVDQVIAAARGYIAHALHIPRDTIQITIKL